MPPMSILVAVDFSAPSRLALERAVAIARAHGARLQLIHAFDAASWKNLRSLATPKKRLLADQPNARAGERLRAMAAQLERDHGIRVSTRMPSGHASRAIAAAARSAQASLVVLGAHGQRLGDRLYLGSTALGVLRGVDCPVLVVRNAAAAPYRNCLVGMDFSPPSARAATAAAVLFPAADLTLLHAVQTIEGPMLLTGELRQAVRAGLAELRAQAGARLAKAFAGPQPGRLAAARRRAVAGPATAALLRALQNGRFDVVALGRDARPALAERVIGSVPANLLTQSPADLLIVP